MAKAKKRSDGRYMINRLVTEADGTKHYKSFYSYDSKQDCVKQYEEYVAGIALPSSRMTYGTWAEQWMETYKRPVVSDASYHSSYINIYQNHIKPYIGEVPLSSLTSVTCQTVLNRCQDMSNSIKIHVRGFMVLSLETAVDNRLIPANPAKAIEIRMSRPKERRVWDADQAERVAAYAADHEYLDVLILLTCGLRSEELLALRWEDLNTESGTVSITRAVVQQNFRGVISDTKTKSSVRTIPMPPVLMEYMSRHPHPAEGLMFPSKSGQVWNKNNWGYQCFNNVMNRIVQDCDVPRLTPHELRHTCGSRLWERTHNLYAVSKFLGHSNVSITASIYVHNTPDILRDALFPDKSDK